jgi:hypothetical protein
MSRHPVFNGVSAVQFGGDGFLITQLFQRTSDMRKPLTFATVLMKRALQRGYTLRAQLSIGDLADVSSTYSEEMQRMIQDQKAIGYIAMHKGSYNTASNMIYNQVIGTSIINAHSLGRPKGPLCVVDQRLLNSFQEQAIPYHSTEVEALLFNWLAHDDEVVHIGLRTLGVTGPTDFSKLLEHYLSEHDQKLPGEWKEGALALLAGTPQRPTCR